jgi:predicted aspartyl protease
LSTLHGESNYKVEFALSVKKNESLGTSCKFRAVLDTGASPVIVQKRTLPKEAEILPLDTPPRLFDAKRRAIAVLGVIVGRINMRKKEYPVEALVAEELSVDLIIGTQFIDQCSKVNLCLERVSCLCHLVATSHWDHVDGTG